MAYEEYDYFNEPARGGPSLKESLYQILYGLQDKQKLKETGEGIQRVREALPGVSESVARGAIASVPGSIGDISEFAREYAPEIMEKKFGRRVAPTTREILDYVPRYTPTHEGASTLEDVAAAISPGVGGVTKDIVLPAAKAYGRFVGPTAYKHLEDYLIKTGGIQQIIQGPESALWKPEMAFQAGKMEAKGVPAEEILQKTGMVRGLDNQWRMELSDQFAKLKQKGASFGEQYMAAKDIDPLQVHLIKAEEAKYGRSPPKLHEMTDAERNDYDIFRMQKIEEHGRMSKAPVTVKDVLDHPELLKAYPELGDIKVKVGSGHGGQRGSYNHGKRTITLSESLTPEQARSTLLHELTHGIQAKENFNRGGNPDMFTHQKLAQELKQKLEIRDVADVVRKGIPNANESEVLAKLENIYKNKGFDQEYLKEALDRSYWSDEVAQKAVKEYGLDKREIPYSKEEMYKNLAGEAEARMVQNRLDLSPEELRKNFPYQYAPEKHGLDIHPDNANVISDQGQLINQPSQSLDIKGYQDEGNFRRVGEPQSNVERFGIAGNEQGRLSGGLIENAGRITRRSDPDSIAAQTELINANINNPQFNKALALAQKHNPEFDIQAIKDMPESSLAKQHSIARTYDLLTKESVSPQLKDAIFNDYLAKHPEMMKKEGITSYDDLVTKSYGALRKEIDQQFDDMVKGGMKLSYHQGDANYMDSREMLRDALVNQHLYTYRGGDVHPLLNDFDPYYGLNSNEKFRAVHDYFGHGTTGAMFGRKGEELAYGAHSQTLSLLAKIAAAAETRGQNSFVNYSGINADLEQKMMTTRIARDQAIHRGESPEQYDAILRDLGGQWQYAKQQGVALPPEMLEPGYKGNIPEYVKSNMFPEYGVSHKGYHYSNKSDLEETDPTKYGYGIRGAEAKRLALPGSIKERTYFYNEPGMREPGLGPNQYEADLNHFYDTENDPAGIIRMADNFNRDKNGILDTAGRANDIERMMREAGYQGYFNQNTGVGISFEPQKVREYSRE
jgi:hypothetical protein